MRKMLILLLVQATIFLVGGGRVQGQTPRLQIVRSASGRVVDQDGEPLPGAAIIDKATGKAAIAEADGTYTLRISDQASTLTFSFLGMDSQESPVKAGSSDVIINATLRSSNELEEAVISVGYGLKQKREDMVGSAYQVSSEEIKDRPAARIDNLLAGLVPGMNVLEDNSSGRTSVKIRIRGDGTLSASNEPLWIIDGVEVYTGSKTNSFSGTSSTVSPLSYLNPDDIESMTVLKDAATTALYGADGARGVILVTTRKAREGQPSYNFSVKYGASWVDRSTLQRFMGASDWLAVSKEAWANAGHPAAAYPFLDNDRQGYKYSEMDTDWFPYYNGVGQTLQANFSAAGGTKKMRSYFSMSYYGNKSPFIGNSDQRISLNFKNNYHFSDRFEAGINLSGAFLRSNTYSRSSFWDEHLPIFTPYNPDGSYRAYNWYSTDNNVFEPVQKRFFSYLDERDLNESYQNNVNAQATVSLVWKPFDGFSVSSETSGAVINVYNPSYTSINTIANQLSSSTTKGYSDRRSVFDYRISEKLHVNYDHTFAGKHKVSAVLGVDWRSSKHVNSEIYGSGFANDNLREVSFSDESTRKGYSGITLNKSLSYLGSLQYNYDKRYAILYNFRRQGNSDFSEYSRWEFFQSVGVRWNVHREHFWNVPWLNELSLELTYGTTGNSRTDSTAYGNYSISSGNYYGGATGANQSSIPNAGLSWERTYKTNARLNVGFLKRFHLTIEPYREVTTDVLYKARLSSVVTTGTLMRNIGTISNTGIEILFESVNIDNGNFRWTTSFNGAHDRNMVEKLNGDAYTGFFDYIWIEGQPKDAFWLVKWAGVDPVSGAPMWYDRNGDLTYSFNYADRVFMPQYSKYPVLFGGLNNSFEYKRLTLNIQLTYSFGAWDYILFESDGSDAIEDNQPLESMNHWRKPGDIALNPKFSLNNSLTAYNTDRQLMRTDNIELYTLSLGYKLPDRWLKGTGIRTCQLSVIGNHLYLWTPAQSRFHNSYKNFKYSSGMTPSVQAQVSLSF